MSRDRFDDNWPLFEKFLGYLRYLKICKYIRVRPKVKCLDIGCGFNGRFLRSISKKIEYGYGIDIRANEGQYNNIEIINNSSIGGNIPLQDNQVDRVFMLAVLEHLDNNNKLINEGIRVLKTGGLLLITTPTPFAKPILEFLSYKLHLISRESIEEHKHYYSKEELIEMFEERGLEVIKYQKFQFGCNELIVGRKNMEDK